MTLAIFDLDNTLLNGDSDHGWGEFIIEKGLVDAEQYRKKNDGFYQDYLDGKLDIFAYQNFCLEQIAVFSPEQLAALLDEYLEQAIKPMITEKARQLVASHEKQGHELLIITATNEIITRPIADLFEIKTLIATEAEKENDHPTGKVKGIPSYAEGKIKRLELWLAENSSFNLEGAYFYSDSHNDLPLLNLVDKPFAVDPDKTLEQFARQKSWPIISLRN